ncbi:uncharacterized protein LOC117650862 [Thrips palmi]|uniref:Uncharacterized protein LOC117650862 n=1 Tax=Thrips palmi TaxID=161013 RepID=A0A6P8ZZ58_THRPL|nr:uncharacterized protein LOC117650862 [Thrips palmi]XP_034250370.1 uncharacterized protein LOC117650862 [Thrips palmi]
MAESRAAGGSLKPWLRHALPTTLALLAAWRWSQAPEESLGGPLVRVEQGLLQGAHRLTLHDAIPYFSFQGIPYARPPVHDLRFKVGVRNLRIIFVRKTAHFSPFLSKIVQNFGQICTKSFCAQKQ